MFEQNPNNFCTPAANVNAPACAVLQLQQGPPNQIPDDQGNIVAIEYSSGLTNNLPQNIFGGSLRYPILFANGAPGNNVATWNYIFKQPLPAQNRIQLPFRLNPNVIIDPKPPANVSSVEWKPLKNQPGPIPRGGIRLQPQIGNLDNDFISDRIVSEGELFMLELYLDPISQLTDIAFIQYNIFYDDAELSFASFVPAQPALTTGCAPGNVY